MNNIKPLGLPVITGGQAAQQAQKPQAQPVKSFQELLNRNLAQIKPQELTFSKHALARTEQRGITISQTDMERLDGAVGKAQDKGLTDTLVFMNNTAFIVNIPSKVVVTVVDSSETDNTVFTNIDGAVIV